MSSLDKNYIVLLDTNCLPQKSHKDKDFQLLLKFSREQKIHLFIAKVAYEEWRTQQRDKIITLVNSLGDYWVNNIVTEGLEGFLDGFIFSQNNIEFFEKKSKENFLKFFDDNKIEVDLPPELVPIHG